MAFIDKWASVIFRNINQPAEDAFAITPNDATDLVNATRAIYVSGTSGDIKVTTVKGTTLVIPAVPSGDRFPIRVSRVWAAGTTATGLIGLM